MNDMDRFKTVNELRAYVDSIPGKAILGYGRVCRYYNGYLHCEFSFIEDDALIGIYDLKYRGKGRVFDGVLLIILCAFLSNFWVLFFFSAGRIMDDRSVIFLALPLVSLLAGIFFIVLGKRLCRRHEAQLDEYMRKNEIYE